MAVRRISIVGLIASAWLLFVGLRMLWGWDWGILHDMLGRDNSTEMMMQHGGKGGVAMIAASFWPFVLLVVGGIGARIYWVLFSSPHDADLLRD